MSLYQQGSINAYRTRPHEPFRVDKQGITIGIITMDPEVRYKPWRATLSTEDMMELFCVMYDIERDCRG